MSYPDQVQFGAVVSEDKVFGTEGLPIIAGQRHLEAMTIAVGLRMPHAAMSAGDHLAITRTTH